MKTWVARGQKLPLAVAGEFAAIPQSLLLRADEVIQ